MITTSSTIELKRLSPAELRKELAVKRAEYARHHIGVTMQSEKNHAACKIFRRDIARMTMVLQDLEKNQRSEKQESPRKSSVSSGSSVKKPVQGVRSKSRKAA